MLGLIARLRHYRRQAAMFVAGVIVVQAFLAGLALAQAALLPAPCIAAAAPATLPEQAPVPRADRALVVKSSSLRTLALPVAARAVRAGLSQAPPSEA